MRTIRASHPKWNNPPNRRFGHVWPFPLRVLKRGPLRQRAAVGVNLLTKVVFAIFEEKTF
jgi:hypothetical protein